MSKSENQSSKTVMMRLVPNLQGLQRILVPSFVILHCLLILNGSLPHTWLRSSEVRQNLEAYMASVGLWQDWEMFAPDPRPYNVRYEVRAYTREGESLLGHLPQGNGLLTEDHFRRWSQDFLPQNNYRFLREAAAHWLALHWAETANSTAAVTMVAATANTSVPDTGVTAANITRIEISMHVDALDPRVTHLPEDQTLIIYDVAP